MQAGNHIATWDGTNISGDVVSSGIYIYQLRTTNSVMTRRMTLLK